MFEFSKIIKISNKIEISEQKSVCFIAEIGVNHNGKIELAKELIDKAAYAGADVVKFQIFNTDEFMSDKDIEYEYKVENKIIKEKMYDMFKRLELKYNEIIDLKKYCEDRNIEFLATPCDKSAVDLLIDLGVNFFKVSSEDLINIELLEYIASKNKPVILSTGMADLNEIEIALEIFKKYNNKDVVLLHCTSVYPTPPEEVNLLRMVAIRDKFNILVGYSDHTSDDIAPIGAVFLGAAVIEKHFTLSNDMAGPDHIFSITPYKLKKLIKKIRIAEKMKGIKKILPSKTEESLRLKFRRSIVASIDIPKGTVITENHITYRRPGNGLKPYQRDLILGKKTKVAIKKNELILPKKIV